MRRFERFNKVESFYGFIKDEKSLGYTHKIYVGKRNKNQSVGNGSDIAEYYINVDNIDDVVKYANRYMMKHRAKSKAAYIDVSVRLVKDGMVGDDIYYNMMDLGFYNNIYLGEMSMAF